MEFLFVIKIKNLDGMGPSSRFLAIAIPHKLDSFPFPLGATPDTWMLLEKLFRIMSLGSGCCPNIRMSRVVKFRVKYPADI
jgi:hypothetical protein